MNASEITIIIFGLVCLGGLYVALKPSPRPTERLSQTPEAGGRAGQTRKSTADDTRPIPSTLDAYERTERSQMPPEIVTGQLVTSERTFRRRGSRAFFAKVDQGFRTADGMLVLVETKNRLRVTTSDIVQLSAQAIAIKSEVGDELGRPAGYAYVRLQLMGGKPRYVRYGLYPESVIDKLVDTYHDLRMRRRHPMARPHPSRCESCVFSASCGQARVRSGRRRQSRSQPAP